MDTEKRSLFRLLTNIRTFFFPIFVFLSLTHAKTHTCSSSFLFRRYDRLKRPKKRSRVIDNNNSNDNGGTTMTTITSTIRTMESPTQTIPCYNDYHVNDDPFCTPQQQALSQHDMDENTDKQDDETLRTASMMATSQQKGTTSSTSSTSNRVVQFGPSQAVWFDRGTPVAGGLEPMPEAATLFPLDDAPPLEYADNEEDEAAILAETKANAACLAAWDAMMVVTGEDNDDENNNTKKKKKHNKNNGDDDDTDDDDDDTFVIAQPVRLQRRSSTLFSPSAKSLLLDDPSDETLSNSDDDDNDDRSDAAAGDYYDDDDDQLPPEAFLLSSLHVNSPTMEQKSAETTYMESPLLNTNDPVSVCLFSHRVLCFCLCMHVIVIFYSCVGAMLLFSFALESESSQ